MFPNIVLNFVTLLFVSKCALVQPQCIVSSFENTKLAVKVNKRPPSTEYANKCIDERLEDKNEKITDIICLKSKVENLKYGAIQNLTGLRFIKFEKNGLTSIEPRAFLNLNRVERVHITDNKLQAILKGVFDRLKQVEEIDLSDNDIEYIQPEAFANLDRLRLLTLARNTLRKWDKTWLTNSPNLFWLDMSQNLVQKLPEASFRPFNKIKHVYFQNNKICKLSPNAFDGTYQLEELHLGNNLIKEITPNTTPVRFARRKMLNRFFLHGNQLMYLPKKFLPSLENVNFLRKSGNPWTCRCNQEIMKKVRENDIQIVKGNKNFPECIQSNKKKDKQECFEEVDENARLEYFEKIDLPYTQEKCPLVA